jgi:hypothetical protein
VLATEATKTDHQQQMWLGVVDGFGNPETDQGAVRQAAVPRQGALLVVYAVEGFLRRLAASSCAANMTLKGGMLMAATSARRMTKDADLATVGVAHEEAAIATAVREIIAVALDGGLAFDAMTIRTELTREDAECHGVASNSRHSCQRQGSPRRSASRSATRTAPS